MGGEFWEWLVRHLLHRLSCLIGFWEWLRRHVLMFCMHCSANRATGAQSNRPWSRTTSRRRCCRPGQPTGRGGTTISSSLTSQTGHQTHSSQRWLELTDPEVVRTLFIKFSSQTGHHLIEVVRTLFIKFSSQAGHHRQRLCVQTGLCTTHASLTSASLHVSWSTCLYT